jgi:hypothetical protein
MNDFEKALRKVQQRQMTHEDRAPTDKRVRDAIKDMGDLAYDVTSLPFQMLTYSPEADAMYFGPKGVSRLEKLGKNLKVFQSQLFGPRSEINIPDDLLHLKNVSPLKNINKAMAESGESVLRLDQIISPKEFPELASAYPELFRTTVKISDWLPNNAAATYKPNKNFDLPFDMQHYEDVSRRINKRNMVNFKKNNPNSFDFPEYVDTFDLYERALPKRLERNPGSIELAIGNTYDGDILKGLLHELGHGIQHIEGYGGADMVAAYTKIDDDLRELVKHRFNNKKDLDDYVYDRNPFEIDTIEATARDLDPSLRLTPRKTELTY